MLLKSFLSLPQACSAVVLRRPRSVESDFPSDEADSNQPKSQIRAGSWTSATFPSSSHNTMTREFLRGSLGTLQAPQSHGLLPVTVSCLEHFRPFCPLVFREFSSTWGTDRRLEVIKRLLNYLMQDELACLPPWLFSWACKQLRKQPFSKSWTRRKKPGTKEFCRRHLA